MELQKELEKYNPEELQRCLNVMLKCIVAVHVRSYILHTECIIIVVIIINSCLLACRVNSQVTNNGDITK
jgi:hypothetical protein